MSAICNSCKRKIPVEYEQQDAADKPCPFCDEPLIREFRLHIKAADLVLTGSNVNVTVTTYPESLLKEAEELIERKQFTLAIVIAQMACEISVERAFVRAFVEKNIQHLEEAVTKLLRSRNITSKEVRKLYEAITGEDVCESLKKVWQDLTDLSKQRNAAIHGGSIYGETEARTAIAAATQLVKYFK